MSMLGQLLSPNSAPSITRADRLSSVLGDNDRPTMSRLSVATMGNHCIGHNDATRAFSGQGIEQRVGYIKL